MEKYSKHYKGHLVDLGCGEAPYKEYFLQYVDKYTGVDWTNTFHNSKADVISNLNEKIDLPDECADVVISLSVIEHLREPQVFLNESYRILKPGGVMILQAPFQWWVHEAPYDYFRYTPYGFEYMFHKAGFGDVVVEPQSGFFTMWLMKFNYFLLRFYRKKLFPFVPIILSAWYINQKIAPVLDRLDRHPELEASGYFVVAKKKDNVTKK